MQWLCVLLLVDIWTMCSTQEFVVIDNNVNSSLQYSNTSDEYNGVIEHDMSVISKVQACNVVVENFTMHWNQGRHSLTNYLETLKIWQCPQFEKECQNRTYALTDFTSKVYSYFCNKTSFEIECLSTIESIVVQQQANSQQQSETTTSSFVWSNVIKRLKLIDLTDDQILEPCVQIAMYEKTRAVGNFREIIRVHLPFCEFSWCGFDEDTFNNRRISAWTCLLSRCQAGIIIEMIVCAILAAAVVIINLTVLLVYYTKEKMRNSQAIFKISLAIADLMVGIVIFPTFASSLSELVFRGRFTGFFIETLNVTERSSTQNLPNGSFLIRITDRTPPIFSTTYFNVVGFFTIVSLAVSIYTLIAASVDRFLALHRPLVYFPHVAKRLAKRLSVSVWGAAFVFAILPMVVPTLRYRLVASVMILSAGPDAIIMYAVAFLIPLVALWILTTATYVVARRHFQARKNLTGDHNGGDTQHHRLTITLSIMVLVFTFSLVPSVILLVASLFIPNIYHHVPQHLDENVSVAYISAEFVSILILTCNSFWNVVIYSARSKEFRSASKDIYRKIAKKINIFKCLPATH
ncbi:unnamed protein product [Clavelina lepadiformis]|uniref:G-protein coupled receptors family 1 profile domain-containing protein n=1 Tax=Clavelina lepadiformis TaxID=159417 RepID=A0ABP0H059_CLALP